MTGLDGFSSSHLLFHISQRVVQVDQSLWATIPEMWVVHVCRKLFIVSKEPLDDCSWWDHFCCEVHLCLQDFSLYTVSVCYFQRMEAFPITSHLPQELSFSVQIHGTSWTWSFLLFLSLDMHFANGSNTSWWFIKTDINKELQMIIANICCSIHFDDGQNIREVLGVLNIFLNFDFDFFL